MRGTDHNYLWTFVLWKQSPFLFSAAATEMDRGPNDSPAKLFSTLGLPGPLQAFPDKIQG